MKSTNSWFYLLCWLARHPKMRLFIWEIYTHEEYDTPFFKDLFAYSSLSKNNSQIFLLKPIPTCPRPHKRIVEVGKRKKLFEQHLFKSFAYKHFRKCLFEYPKCLSYSLSSRTLWNPFGPKVVEEKF